MERVDYLSGIRRRWFIVAAAVIAGMLGAWFTRSTGPATVERFRAQAPILGSTDPSVTNLPALAALTTLGEVPRRVADALNYQGDPADLAAATSAGADQTTGILWVTSTAPTAQGAERLANTFARELVGWVADGQRTQASDEASRLQDQMDELTKEIGTLERQLAHAKATETAELTAQRDAAVRHFGVLQDQYNQATDAEFSPPSLSILQGASATPVVGDRLLGPLSPAARVAVGGALGLLAGLALALLLERFDRRIRTKAGAEASFRLPVLAEIPSAPRRRANVLDQGDRASSGLQPFRLLGAVLATSRSHAAPVDGNGHGSVGRTILVTSPGTSEGKSHVAGGLAASFAESGNKVLVVSCDLRQPSIHKLLGVASEPGLSDALQSTNGHGLYPFVQSTTVPNLKVIPSGPPTENPSRLIGSDRMAAVLEQAREVADIVLVDAAPILATGDATYLLPDVDSVLVVARPGKTTRDEAERTAELLERVDAPVAGVALDGTAG